MLELIKKVEGIVAEVEKHPYTPFREAAIGALKSFLEKAPEHIKEIAKGKPETTTLKPEAK